MKDILACYGQLLQEVDEWFDRSMRHVDSAVSCREGCSECCRGLFDITLLDACYLKSGFELVDAASRQAATARAKRRLASLRAFWPEFTEPYILNDRPEEDWEELMPDDDETPCPLLGADGRCLVYAHRPMTCRLHGLPLVDVTGEILHDEWCTLNFVQQDPLRMSGLRWEFTRLFRDEVRLFRQYTERLVGFPVNELDTFIPMALLIDFDGFDWQRWGSTAACTRKPAA